MQPSSNGKPTPDNFLGYFDSHAGFGSVIGQTDYLGAGSYGSGMDFIGTPQHWGNLTGQADTK